VSDAGLKIAAHFYNQNIKAHGGRLEAVLTGKVLEGAQRQAMVWDIERGAANALEPFPWQTDTCIGSWHYDRRLYDRDDYKSAATVVQMLADIVSKNGNLLLNVPLRGDGSLDEKELAIVEGIASWMAINREAIFDTRPWVVFGEGPAAEGAAPLSAEGFNEGKGKPFTAEDKRFTAKGGAIYVIVLGRPVGPVTAKSLGRDAGLLKGEVVSVSLLGGGGPLKWSRDAGALTIVPPATLPSEHTVVFKVTTKD
jgi:alpha-L-fucosidase